jgi:hypothetical protein
MHSQPWRLGALVLAVVVATGLSLGIGQPALRQPRPAALSFETPMAGTSRAATTTVRRVRLLDAHGHLRARYVVVATRRGHCWTTSFVNGHLYRCFQGNLVRDPCWKESGRRSVVCPVRPWSSRVTRLRLTKGLPDTAAAGPRLWALRLGGVGVSCVVSMGAGGLVGNHPISYLCQRGWVLLGAGPNRTRALWTMLSARWVKDHYELRGRKSLPTAWKPVAH